MNFAIRQNAADQEFPKPRQRQVERERRVLMYGADIEKKRRGEKANNGNCDTRAKSCCQENDGWEYDIELFLDTERP